VCLKVKGGMTMATKYMILKTKEWFSKVSKGDRANAKKWGWDKREDYMAARLNEETNYISPMKFKFKTKKAAFDYIATRIK